MQKGIIVGLNSTIEYLLPFFYTNLRLHCDLPITFFDYGMSVIGRTFCQKRGDVMPIHDSVFHKKEAHQGSHIKEAWFKKPLSCLEAPYDLNLWIDLDIMVRGSFDPVFHPLIEGKQIAICQEYEVKISKSIRQYKTIPVYDTSMIKMLETLKSEKHLKGLIPSQIPIYNSGFFAFKKNNDFIKPWIDLSIKLANSSDIQRIGDQDTLSFALFDMPSILAKLPVVYNYVIKAKKNKKSLLDAELYPIKSLKKEHIHLQEAINIHFAGSAKDNLLERFMYFEKLSTELNTYYV